jgi:cytoskeletal protein RodZ
LGLARRGIPTANSLGEEEKHPMAEKVALPSLSLPKQRTHWSVHVVIAASVLFLVMCAAFYLVLQRQKDAEAAFAKRQEDHAVELKAKAEAERAAAERATPEAKKTEAETAAAAAADATEKKKAAAAAAATQEASKRKASRRSTKVAKGGATSSPSAPAAAPEKPRSKESKSIDDLLKSFK